MRKQTGFAALEALLLAATVIVIATVGLLIYWHGHRENLSRAASQTSASQSCEPTLAMIASNFYDVPCSILITLKGPPFADASKVQEIVKPIHGTVNPTAPDAGIYEIKVKPGTEDSSITYLKAQPEIQDAIRSHCCYDVAN